MSGADGPIGRREVAHRLFAAEYDDADLEYSDSDEERAPNYVVTPTGARVNRVFVVGVLTEVEPVSDEVLRARVVDPTGAFVVYAGQYQPEAVTFLEGAEVPSFVAVTGKARTFRPDDGDRVYTSLRPETMTTVDAETRDRWTVQAAEHTLARVATMAAALDREERGEALERALREAGVAAGLAAGVALALDHYGTTPAYLEAVRAQALGAAAVVAGDRDEVPPLDLAPGEGGAAGADLTAAPAVHGTLAGGDAAALEAVAAVAGEASSAETAATAADGPDETGHDEAADPTPDATADATPDAPADPTEDATASDDEGDDDLGDFAPTDEPADEPPTEAPEPAAEAAVEPEPDLDPEPEPSAEEPPTAAPEPEPQPEVDAPSTAEVDEVAADPSADASAEAGLYELDDAEREAVEAEFGTEFSTGGDVGEPGEAGIEPEAEQPEADAGEPEDDEGDEDADVGDASGEEGDGDAADVDLEDAVVEAMREFDEGDGADRDAVVASVVDEHGADAEAVEAAVQDALMGGRCYEPTDGTLKAI